MKDEAMGVIINEFVGLRSKMYSYTKESGKGGKTAEGIKKSVIKKSIAQTNYLDVLVKEKQLRHSMKTIRSKCHKLGSYEVNKTSLSCFDDKRHLLRDGVTNLAYGHYKINP